MSAGSVQHAALAPTRLTRDSTGGQPFHCSEVMMSRRLLSRGPIPVIVLIVASVACMSQRSHRGVSQFAIDRIVPAGTTLAWDRVLVGASRSEVERALNQELDVTRGEPLVCGEYESSILLHGFNVVIQWSSANADARVDSITVRLAADEAAASAIDLSGRLIKKRPQLRVRADHAQTLDFSSLSLVANPDLVVLINTAGGYLFRVRRFALISEAPNELRVLVAGRGRSTERARHGWRRSVTGRQRTRDKTTG